MLFSVVFLFTEGSDSLTCWEMTAWCCIVWCTLWPSFCTLLYTPRSEHWHEMKWLLQGTGEIGRIKDLLITSISLFRHEMKIIARHETQGFCCCCCCCCCCVCVVCFWGVGKGAFCQTICAVIMFWVKLKHEIKRRKKESKQFQKNKCMSLSDTLMSSAIFRYIWIC